jgi:hypothetical protein
MAGCVTIMKQIAGRDTKRKCKKEQQGQIELLEIKNKVKINPDEDEDNCMLWL